MTKIRTAEEILIDKGIIIKDKPYINTTRDRHEGTKLLIQEAMQEHTKQYLDLAAEEAKVKYVYLPRDGERQAIVDTESILKLKERVV